MTIQRQAMVLEQQLGELAVRYHPETGGRLASLRYAGVDLVLPPGQVPGYYGDTFWPSPQSQWDWPPPPALDAEPYDVIERTEHEISMRSGVDPGSGLRVDKRFVLAEDTLTCGFAVANDGGRPIAVAPWQVTRAPRAGLLVWAPGETFADDDRLHKQQVDPGCWYLHTGSPRRFGDYRAQDGYASLRVDSVAQTSKFFTDARGWVAHIHHRTMFLRQFPDLSLDQMAPQQAELELFFGLERDYIELENQGTYERLEPGTSLTYQVRWRFGPVPPGVPDDRVSAELLAAIDALASSAR